MKCVYEIYATELIAETHKHSYRVQFCTVKQEADMILHHLRETNDNETLTYHCRKFEYSEQDIISKKEGAL